MKHQQIISNNDADSDILVSSGNRFGYYYLNVFIFIGVSYLVIQFNKNPILIGILIGILVLVVLPINFVEYLFAENDKLVVLYKRVFFLQFLNRRRIFKYEEIKKITATLKLDKKTDAWSIVIDLTTKFAATTYNSLEVEMKNGKMRYINSKIYIEKLLPIINFMKSNGVDIQIIYPNNKDI